MTAILRLAITIVIVVLLARSAWLAWGNRTLALSVWRRIRLRHVVGSALLLLVVLSVAVALIATVPVTAFGLGSLLGVAGNAVFTPVEQVATLDDPADSAATTTVFVVLATGGFLGLLLALFPWLAYVEEQMFRAGLEHSGVAGQIWTALRFGLIHMVMLVPLAAALAIGVAGFWYGRIYLRTFRRLAADDLVAPVIARREAVLASTVWHATFNSLVVVLLLIVLAVDGSLV